MGRATTARSAGHKQIRSIISTGYTSVTSQAITIPRTIAGDTIVCLVSTSGSPTITGSSTGGSWRTIQGGNAAPYVWMVIGIPTAGTTSFTLTISASSTLSTVTTILSGVNSSPLSGLSSVSWGWTSASGNTSTSFTPNIGDVVVIGLSQFSGTSVTATDSRGQQVQNRGLNNTNSRPVALLSFVDRTGLSQTISPVWNNAQTGGGLIVVFPHL